MNIGKKNTTRQTYRGGGGGDGEVNQEAERELIKLQIGEPALSRLARHPRITLRMVEAAALPDHDEADDPGTGLIIIKLDRALKAAEVKHHQKVAEAPARAACQKREREAEREEKKERIRVYQNIVAAAYDDERRIIEAKYPTIEDMARADPIGKRLSSIDIDLALQQLTGMTRMRR